MFDTIGMFLEAWTTAAEIQWNQNWKLSMQNLSNAVKGEHAPKLQVDEMRKCKDQLNRKVLLVGTRFGNVLVFERYLYGIPGTIVWNYPEELDMFPNVRPGAVNASLMDWIVGHTNGRNCGWLIELIYQN